MIYPQNTKTGILGDLEHIFVKSQGWELLDENDELLYLVALDELQKQLKRIEKSTGLIFADMFWMDELALMMPVFAPAIEKVISMGARNSVVGTPLAFVDIEVFRNASQFAQTYSYDLIKNINSTTRKEVSKLIQQHILEDLPLSDVYEELRPVFGEVRASLIAVTESTRAFNHGAVLVADQLRGEGFLVQEIWNTVNDGLVCDDCYALNGTARGTLWSNPDPLHPGCRCFITNQIVEL